MSDAEITGGDACGCARGSCRKGPAKWIWIVLLLAIGAVLVARYRGPARKTEAAPAVPSTGQAEVCKALPRLLDLGAGKCVPCKMMMPILADLRESYTGKLEVAFIDVWEDPEAAKPYEIRIIPTQIFYDADGKELFRHEGFFAKEDILAKWKELGVELNP